MTIKQQGGIFGRNPEFNEVDANTGSFTDLTATNLTTTKDGAVSATFNRLTSKGDMLLFEYNGSRIGSLGLEASGLYLDGEDSHMGIKFVSSQLFPRDDGVDTNGSNDLGGTNNRWRNLYLDNNVIVSSGGGIDFSATSGTGTSELFDDYEEGIHTTTLTPNSGSITLSTSYNTLSYTKVGSIVHVWGQVRVDSVSSPSGYAILSMPFAAATGSQRSNRSAAATWTYNLSSAQDELLGILYNGTDELRLAEGITHSGDFSGKIQATSQIAVSVTYTVA